MSASQPDPLVQCLLFIARYHGISTTGAALASGFPLDDDSHLTPTLVTRAAERIGLAGHVVRDRVADLPEGLLPALLVLNNKQACVLISRDEQGQCEVFDPRLGEGTVSTTLENLQERSADCTIVLRPKFRFDARVSRPGVEERRHWFWGVVLENAPVYRDVLLAAFFINLFALASPLFVMNVYDRVVPNFAEETLWALSLGMILVILTDITLRTMRGYFIDLAAQRADVKISASIMEKILGIRLEARPSSVGSFAANLRSFEMVRDFLASATIAAFVDIPFALVFLAMIAWLAWPLTLPLLFAILIIIVYARVTSKRVRSLAELAGSASAQRNATLVESLVGLDTLKALGAESHMQSRWERATSFLSRVTVQLRLLAASSSNLALWAQQTAYVTVIVVGVYRIAEGELTLGGLIACSILTSRALMPFAQLAGLITQYHNAMTALDTLNDIMQKPVERPPGSQFLSRRVFRGDIEFKNVSFQYPEGQLESIRGINLKITAGERIGVLGRVGSGKSTLQRLAIGLYQPTEGAVAIDGIDLRQLDPAELRNAFGYVPQDTTLFYGTLRQNLLMAQPQCDDEQLMKAVELAGLSEFVKTHPQGLDMLVGERGDSLSGGQRKAVSLARGLVHDPGIVLLDEPTSAMDHSTEQQVRGNLQTFMEGKTVIMVTHHTSLLELVDRLVVMDRGKIVADGPKEQVVEALKKGRIGSAT